jgi:hypothetical protein
LSGYASDPQRNTEIMPPTWWSLQQRRAAPPRPEVIFKQFDPSTKSSGEEVFAWLQGGGEMGELIRNTDWAQTRLGPAANWSHTH